MLPYVYIVSFCIIVVCSFSCKPCEIIFYVHRFPRLYLDLQFLGLVFLAFSARTARLAYAWWAWESCFAVPWVAGSFWTALIFACFPALLCLPSAVLPAQLWLDCSLRRHFHPWLAGHLFPYWLGEQEVASHAVPAYGVRYGHAGRGGGPFKVSSPTGRPLPACLPCAIIRIWFCHICHSFWVIIYFRSGFFSVHLYIIFHYT